MRATAAGDSQTEKASSLTPINASERGAASRARVGVAPQGIEKTARRLSGAVPQPGHLRLIAAILAVESLYIAGLVIAIPVGRAAVAATIVLGFVLAEAVAAWLSRGDKPAPRDRTHPRRWMTLTPPAASTRDCRLAPRGGAWDAESGEGAIRSKTRAADTNAARQTLWSVVVALAVNCIEALALGITAWLSDSVSLRAQTATTAADVAVGVFLLIGLRSSTRPADETHPLGYEREGFFWSLFAALGIFVGGSGFALDNAVRNAAHPSAVGHYAIAYLVLARSSCGRVLVFGSVGRFLWCLGVWVVST
jgi:hypothetical protein